MYRLSRVLFSGVLATLTLFGLSTTCNAQLNDWASIPVSPSAVVKKQSTVVVVQDGNKTSAFSCFNRRWTTLNTFNSNPAYTLYNEFLILQDGGTFWGYSAHTGSWSPIVTFSGTAAQIAATGGQTWIGAVRDGKTVYLYFALSGRWQTYTFPNTPTVSYRNFAALISDGTTVYGVSAYHESPIPLPVNGANINGCYGPAGVAFSPGLVHGFSAYQNSWASSPVSVTPTITTGYANNPGFVTIQDGSTIQFFSGTKGTFTTIPAPPTSTIYQHREVAVVVDSLNGLAYAYSGMTSTVGSIGYTPGGSVYVDQYFAIIHDGVNGYYPFASVRGQFFNLPLPGSGFTVKTGQNMAVLMNGTVPVAGYAALADKWEPTPAIPSATAYVGASAAILVDSTNSVIYALSVRDTLGWVPESNPNPDAVYIPTTPQGPSGLIVVRNGNTLKTFGPRTEIWHSITMSAAMTAQSGHVSAEVFSDGINAYGFGTHTDRWSVQPLLSPPTPANVQTDTHSGMVRDNSRVYGFSAVGQTYTGNDYPDFYRYAPIGGVLKVVLAGDPYYDAYLLAADSESEIAVPPYGTLLLNPASATTLAMPYLNGEGLANLYISIPNDPILVGVDVYFQTFMNGPSGYYLTNSTQIAIF